MTLKKLIEQGLVFPALLPANNDAIFSEEGKKEKAKIIEENRTEDFQNQPANQKIRLLDLNALDDFEGYTVTPVAHDYGGKTPSLWNAVYANQGLNLISMMVVGNPDNAEEIFEGFRADPKYIGGGTGAGFKEKAIAHLDGLEPVDINSINIVTKRNGRLVGLNTDAEGLMRSLEEKLHGLGKKAQGEQFVVIGAGGVAQQFTRALAERDPERITLVNRTYSKAEDLAAKLNEFYRPQIARAIPEEALKDELLNARKPYAAIINTSEKGGDALPDATMFFPATPNAIENTRDLIRKLKHSSPEMIYADITLPKSGRSTTLRLLDEQNIDEAYLLDGKPMVTYQAIPAYQAVERDNPKAHRNQRINPEKLLEIFRNAS